MNALKDTSHSPNFIDLHYHANPDAFVRRHGAIDAGKLYAAANGRVVLKTTWAALPHRPGKRAHRVSLSVVPWF